MYYCIIAVNIIMKDDGLQVTKRQPLCFASQPFGSAEPTVLVRYLHLYLLYENLNEIPITERILNVLNNKSGKQQEYLVHMLEEMSFGLDKLL